MNNYPVFTLKINTDDPDVMRLTRDSWNDIMRCNPEYAEVPLVILGEGVELELISLDHNDELIVCEWCSAINYSSNLDCRKCGGSLRIK